MNTRITLIFAVVMLLFSCGGNNKEKTTVDSPLSADELEQKALIMYQDYPKKALASFIKVAAAYENEGNKPKTAIAYLNVANIFDEHYYEYEKALVNAHKSLNLWSEIKDEMQIANLRKYTGYLNGMLGNFEAGKADIKEAMRLYNKMAYDQGMAVSQFNLARVLYQEGNYEESAEHFEKTLKYWQKEENPGRLFSIHTFGIDLFRKLNDTNRVEKFKEENYKMMTSIKLPETEVNKFKKTVDLVE